MGIGTSNAVAIGIVPEVTFGVTPATPAFEQIRFTGESLNLDLENVTSEEIRADRNRADSVRVRTGVSGDLSFELSIASMNTLIQAALCGTWSAPTANLSNIKNGLVKRSFTFQKKFNDTDTVLYQNLTGIRIDTLELNLTPGEIVTGSVSVMGKNGAMTPTAITGQTAVAAPTTRVMNATGDVSAILDNGVTSTELYNSMSISIGNNLRSLEAIGNLGPVDINYGVMDVTGNIEFYFKNATVYTRFVNNTAFSMSVKLQDETGDYYNIKLPRMKLETAEITAGGLDQDLTVSCSWRAMYDPTSQCQIEIEKFDAP